MYNEEPKTKLFYNRRKCFSSINLKEDLKRTDYKNYDLLTLAIVTF